MISKKALAPVVATSLLLVVAVISVTSFDTFQKEFISNLGQKAETQKTRTIDLLELTETATSNEYNIYLSKQFDSNIVLDQALVNGNQCNFTGQNVLVNTGVTEIGLACSNSLQSSNTVLVIAGYDTIVRTFSD